MDGPTKACCWAGPACSAYATEVQVFADGPILLARLAAPPLVPSAYFHPQFTRVGGRRAAAHHRRVLGPHRLPLLRLHPPVDHVAVDWAWISVAHWDRL